MENNKKIIRVTTVVLLLIAGIFIYINRQATSFQNVQVKTYTNSFQNYSVDYPDGWFVKEGGIEGRQVSIASFDVANPSLNIPRLDSIKFSVDVVVFENSRNLTLEEFITSHDLNNYEGTGTETKVITSEQVTINNYPAIKRTILNASVLATEVFIKNVDKIYLIAAPHNLDFQSSFEEITNSFKINNTADL